MTDAAISDDLLNTSATATRPIHAPDGQGGDIETLAIHPTNSTLNVRYYASSGSRLIIAARDDEKINHIAYVKPDAAIEVDDRLFMDDKRFDVVAALLPSKAHHIKLQLEEVHGVYLVVTTKAGFTIHTKDDDGNLTVLEMKA
jgi:hypothetical protein